MPKMAVSVIIAGMSVVFPFSLKRSEGVTFGLADILVKSMFKSCRGDVDKARSRLGRSLSIARDSYT